MNTNMTMEKRILSVLLTVIMVFSMVPLSVFAADGSVAEVTVGNTTTSYSDLASAFTAVQYASGSVTVKLLDDVDRFATGNSRTDGVQLSNSVDVTLDLNGHYIDRYNNAAGTNANKKAVFYVTGSAKLTVMDSVGGGNIIQTINSTPSMIVDSGASLTVLSGTISSTGSGCGIRIDSGILAVDGGTISTSFDAGICVGGGTVTVTGDAKIHSGKSNALLITGESSVTLSGGTYTTNETNKRSILTTVGKVEDLLADGFRFTDSNGLDVAITEDGTATDSDNVTVSDFGIKYIDSDGKEQKRTNFTELTESTEGAAGVAGWYVVKGTVNMEGAIGVTGNDTLNLILCDGATLNLKQPLYMLGGSTLNIYGQNGGTGTLIVESSICQPGIGIMVGFSGGTVAVNIYGGTVTVRTVEGAQPIGSVPALTTGKANVTIAKGMKCVKTDDQSTAYPYNNTDGTSITITKCTDHKWSYTNKTDDTHDQSCDLCGTTETAAHSPARYQGTTNMHRVYCACGKDYATERHSLTSAPNDDGLTHEVSCAKCGEVTKKNEIHSFSNKIESEGRTWYACECGANHAATYDGKKYASLQCAIDAVAPVGGTVTLAPTALDENVVITDGTVTIDLDGKRWIGNINDELIGNIDIEKKYIPLTVNDGSVTLKNGELFQWWSGSSARTGIMINGGSVTVEKDVRVMGGRYDSNVPYPSITLNDGTLILKEGATLLSGLTVPEDKALADYLPEGTAFVKCSYDYSSDTVTVSDPQEFVPDVYTANSITEEMVVVSHTHDFSNGTACPCGFNCEHSMVDEDTGKCETCGTQVYAASLTKADGTKQSYASFADAWNAATDNEGSTLKLLCDITLNKAENGIIAHSGKFTFDLNGKTVSGDITNQLLTVSDTADITVRNGKLINTFNIDRTDINNAYANALEIDGGAVTLDQVELIAGQIYQGARSYATSVFGGSLTVIDGTFTGMLAVKRDISETPPSVKITSATLHNGMLYSCYGTTDFDYAGLKAFFADGSMLFDENSKYIDITNDNYWVTEAYEEYNLYVAGFYYENGAIVKPHTHETYVDGKCAECDYACPHDSGINDSEAGYFEKAICSICHSEYGDYAKDNIAPTGEILIQGRTWWQTVLNKISFGLFYKEDASAIITATDDSYSQPGFDEAKHAVKIEFLISGDILSEEAVKASKEFRKYTMPISFSTEQQYVVYVRLTDHAGNVAYAGSAGFEVDKTAPVIKGYEGYKNGETVNICGDLTLTFEDANLDKVTQIVSDSSGNDTELPLTLTDGKYTLVPASQSYIIKAVDKAGNITTVTFNVGWRHSFDPETKKCSHCGQNALVEQTIDGKTVLYDSFDSALSALWLAGEYESAELKLLGDVSESGSILEWGVGKRIFNLNGHTFNLTPNANGWGGKIYATGSIDLTITGGGTMDTDFYVYNGGTLTVDLGDGKMKKLIQTSGSLEVVSGTIDSIEVSHSDDDPETSRTTELCGGHYGEIKIVGIEGLTCADLLGSGYRFEGLSLEQAKVTELSNVTVELCYHENIDENYYCSDCGVQFALAVRIGNTETLFDTFERAVRYAEEHDGCTVKLLQNLTLDDATVGSLMDGYSLVFGKGEYTLDLNGKTLNINNNYFNVYHGCKLTIGDSVGGGKVTDPGMGRIAVDEFSRLTVTGGEFNTGIQVSKQSSLVLKGGSFQNIRANRTAGCTPFDFIADGYTFANTDGSGYASEGNVVYEGGDYYIENVTVVPAPLTIDEQPTDLKFYLTSREDDKYVEFAVSSIGRWWGDMVNVTFEKEDGTVIEKTTVPAYENMHKGLSAVNFKVSDSGMYRIKLELKGYVLYSNTFNITVAECEHPGYDMNTGKCTQCHCDLAAAIVKDGKTTGYVNFADALTAAQTDANKGCTLKLLADVSGTVGVDTGEFAIEINGKSIIGNLQVKKAAKVNIYGGTIREAGVTVARTAQLTASNTLFAGAINCVGGGDFKDCIFMGAVSAKGSSFKLSSCEIHGTLSVSGSAEAEECTVSGTVTVNNGGSFKSTGGTYGNTVNAKSGGTLEIISGTYNKKLTAEEGSKLIISGGSYTEVKAKSNVDFTLSGGEFTNITVNGQLLIDCLADGKAFEDMNNGDVIDGRVGIAGNVKVVDHTHTCVWKTDTHEKLCGCGFVEATDTEAPIISGVKDGGVYYNLVYFYVTDANDFTVTVDGAPVQVPRTGYRLLGDNRTHTITATDVAGNTVTITVTVYKMYFVTLPRDTTGYTVKGAPAVGHGMDYEFTVKIADGYSKTENYRVLVNGTGIDAVKGDETEDTFLINNVSEEFVITVEGVADITAPEVEVNIRGNSFKEFLNRITFGLFYKETQTVQITAADNGSGIAKVEYLLSKFAFTDKGAVTGDWTELTLDDGKTKFNIEPSRKMFIYVRVTDISGNITVVNSDGVVVYTDAEAIIDAETFTMDSDRNVIYGFKPNGNSILAVYNGTEEIHELADYSLIENGANAALTLKNKYLRTLAAGEYTIRLTFKPLGEAYADNACNDAPAEVVFELTVEKKTPTLGHKESDGKIYDGKSIGTPTHDTDSDGTVTFEYKKLGEDDTAYTTEAPKNVGKYVIRITTAETDTFKTLSSTMEFEIQPKDVTISDTLVSDKEYNGNTDASITSVGTIKGLADGDNVTIAVGKATFADKNAGANKTVTFSDFSLSGSDASNYTLVSQPSAVTANITVKEIAINGAEVESTKVYDGTTTATITNIGTPSENFDGDDLTVIPGTAAYADKNVGNGKTVTFSGFTLSGDAAANYTVISQPADTMADITAKEITIVGALVEQTKVYDGTTAATVTNAGTPSVNYDGDNLTIVAGKAAYDNKNVGTGKTVTFTGFTLAGDAAANYKLIAQPESVTADITVKEIKIVNTAVETSKIYDGNTDAKITVVGTFDGLVDGDKVNIVTGKAAYNDKNVGSGKTVAFYDFALSGDDAANYVLSAQPVSTTASISAKELTIKDLKVKDKQYDGKNTAEIDGMPTLVGVVDGDVLTLVNGVPTFDSVKIGKSIPVSFTAFTLSGDRVTVGNYTLTQPSGITANIVEYAADGSEYEVNSNDWINKDFVITAKEGYKLSLTDTANGEWADSLTASDETGNGKLTFFVKNTETGVISAAVTENYKIDKTAPTGEVKVNERTAFQKLINAITFGLFFKDDVNVKLTAKDETSGVRSILYFKSDRILTDEEVRAITDWTDNSDFDIEAKDMDKFVIYVRIEDNAGNVTLIGSDGATFDTTAPEIVGVIDGKTYYVTKKVAIDDENLESVTLNGEPVEDVFPLAGDTEATYVIRAVDKAGNVTEYTVYMKPISSITDAISAITADNVKSSDAETISAVERQILDIAEAFDDGESTDDEWNKLTEAAAKCKDLNKRIADVADEITRLTDAVTAYDIDKVTSADKADIEKLIADIDALLGGDNLTDAERAALEALKGTARALLDRIAAAKDATEDEITAVDGIAKDNVKLEDKEALEKAENALEGALRDFDGNYTEEENADLEEKLETVKAALAAIGNAEKAAEEIGKLPSADDAKLSDKSELDRVKKLLEGLTENEKAMLGKDALGKVDALAEKIKKLAEETDSPKTGDTSNLALWIALLFISGGIVTGTTVVSKKKKRSVK